MDAVSGIPQTRLELAESIAARGDLCRRMEGYARRRFRLTASEVEDLMQDVLMELMRYDEPVRAAEGLAFRVLHLRCLQLLRRRGVRAELPLEMVALSDGDVEEPVQSEPDIRIFLRQALSRSTPACRRLIRAHYLEGRTLKETAEALSYSSSNVVWTLLDRCIRRLRAAVGVSR